MIRPVVEPQWRQRRRIGRLVCGVAVVIGLIGALPAGASAQTPAQNPVPDPASPSGGRLQADCGLKVMLVLDESASINATDVGRTRDAANTFVDALRGTGSQLAITAFAIRARTLIDYEEVTGSSLSDFRSAVNRFASSVPSPGRNGTNWYDAFRLVNQLNGTSPASLVVFMTDGNPNTTGTYPNHTPPQENATGWANATGPSITQANTVKAQGSRIFAMGVGAALNDATSQARLQLVSGSSEFGTGAGENNDFKTADWTRVVTFAGLKSALTDIVAALCGSRLIVTKYVSDPDGRGWTQPARASSPWTFTATLDPSPAHTWLEPEQGTQGSENDPSARLSTDEDAQATFAWRLDDPGTATVNVRETRKDGYRFVSADCTNTVGGVEQDKEQSTDRIPEGELRRTDYRECRVFNKAPAAKLTVVKKLDPPGDPGRFNLLVNGETLMTNVPDNGRWATTGQLLVRPGEVEVAETAGTQPATSLSDYDTSIRCVNRADNNAVVVDEDDVTGADLRRVELDLARNDDVKCTITNRSNRFGTVTVIKRVVPPTAPGAFDLLINGAPPNAQSSNVGDGGTTGRVRLPFGDHQVSERIATGQPVTLDAFSIHTECIDEPTGDVLVDEAGPTHPVTLSRRHSDIQCTITNTLIPPPQPAEAAQLRVVKRLVPSDDVGIFDLLVDGKAWALGVGDGGRTASLDFGAPTTATVSERGANGTDLADFSIRTTCRADGGDGRAVASGTGRRPVAVPLRAGDDVVCTITNRRVRDDTVPEGGVVLPDEGTAAGDPNLAIGKTMPARARVGQRVPVTITVKNVGQATATGVRIGEKPPSGRPIVRAANNGRIQRNGTADWRLGSLAPGQSRTVRATARVTRAGTFLNVAVATASNADPAVAQATVRARGAARRPPSVTG